MAHYQRGLVLFVYAHHQRLPLRPIVPIIPHDTRILDRLFGQDDRQEANVSSTGKRCPVAQKSFRQW